MVGSAWLLLRAVEDGRTKHLVWCGVLVGLAFMTKMLQGWMLVPALAGVYLVTGPPRLRVRLRQLAFAGVAMVAVSAAWPVAVSLWPAASRPYIGGSTNGSVWDLILGYNGFGRITGAEGGGVGGGQFGGPGGGGGFGGTPGLWRMFNDQVGSQIAWLLPLAFAGLVAGLWLTRRASRTDRARAGWLLFGGWAVIHVAVFSTAQGIFHPYYTSALAPAVAALSGAGLVALVRWARGSWAGLALLGAAIALTAWVAVDLLARTPDFAPWLRTVIPVAAGVAILGSLALRLAPRGRAVLAAAAVAGALALAAGPASYSVATLGQSLTSSDVHAGPAGVSRRGPGGGGQGGPPAGFARRAGAGAGTFAGPPPGAVANGRAFASGPGGGSVSDALVSYLEAHQGTAKYLVAADGSHTTAPIIIKSGKAVVTIGGFSGADPAPTTTQLAQMVKSGELRYVLVSADGGGGPGGGRFGGSQALTTWVQQHGTKVTGVDTGGMTLYRVSA
jgi:4-amino-4-deoxy-L-arabinose transferase-like glycosyltransferase